MSYHLPTLDSNYHDQNYPFAIGWIFVEFFFIITGCFTFKHFYDVTWSSTDDAGKKAIHYTAYKFSPIMPFVFVSYVLRCGIGMINGESNSIVKAIPEILLISRGEGKLPVLWFLSAMFLVFPVFCCICQIKQKHLLYIVSMLSVVIIYDTFLISLGGRTPTHLIRAMAGLLLGVLVYYFSRLIKQMDFSLIGQVVLLLVEELSLILAVYLTFNNSDQHITIILCFFIGLSLIMSGKTLSIHISSKITDFLGKCSLIMYLNSDFCALFLNMFIKSKEQLYLKVILYYVLDFTLSAIIYYTFCKVKRRDLFHNLKNKIRKIEL